jgi:uncharacterized protein
MKGLSFRFHAYGHPNITATHPTTLEITTDDHVTSRGNCIVAVRATCGVRELSSSIRDALSRDSAVCSLTIQTGSWAFRVQGRGSSRLTFRHPRDMVIRKSNFVSDRTLMVGADKAAQDIPKNFLNLLQDDRNVLTIEIQVT